MTLDDLKNDWLVRDQRLEKGIQLNTKLFRESFVDRHSSSIRRQSLLGFLIELPFYILTLGVLGKFIASHIGEIKFVVPALLLEAWGIAMLISLIRQFGAAYRLDLGEPVIALQKKLAAIRLARLRTFKWGFLSGMVVWCAPFFIVMAKGVLNIDLYAVSAFLAFNIFGASVLALLIVAVLNKYGTHWQHLSFIRGFLDSVAGRDIEKASAFVKQLSNFEREEMRT